MNYMTVNEIQSLVDAGLHGESAFIIPHASTTIFSVARHYGGCKINGFDYTYLKTDELVRKDVLAWLKKHRKQKKMSRQVILYN